MIPRAAGARKLVKTLRAEFSGGADPEGRRRQIVAPLRRDQPPCRPNVLLPPGDVACRRSSLPVSARHMSCFPTGSTPGTDIILVSKNALRTWLSGGG
jgi:hypothetical protein